MALACPITEHPVGAGTFCRICGRDYITVPDPVGEDPAPVESPAVETAAVESPAPPPLPESAFKHEAPEPSVPEPSPFAELHVPTEPPPPADPVLDTGLIETRFAEMTAPEAPLGDLAAVTPVPEAEPDAEEPAAKAPRAVPPAVLHALAGGGVGAVLMALVDRFVL